MALASLEHPRKNRAYRVNDTIDVDIDHPGRHINAELPPIVGFSNPGICEHQIARAQGLLQLRNGGIESDPVGHISSRIGHSLTQQVSQC